MPVRRKLNVIPSKAGTHASSRRCVARLFAARAEARARTPAGGHPPDRPLSFGKSKGGEFEGCPLDGVVGRKPYSRSETRLARRLRLRPASAPPPEGPVMSTITADPYAWPFDGDLTPANTCLVVID